MQNGIPKAGQKVTSSPPRVSELGSKVLAWKVLAILGRGMSPRKSYI